MAKIKEIMSALEAAASMHTGGDPSYAEKGLWCSVILRDGDYRSCTINVTPDMLRILVAGCDPYREISNDWIKLTRPQYQKVAAWIKENYKG